MSLTALGWPCRVVAVTLASALLTASAGAQTQNMFNPRDEEYRLLGLIRAKAEWERATAEWERARELNQAGILPSTELDLVRSRMEHARVDYLQASLAVLFEQPHVLIERAVKVHDPDGNPLVRLTLRNTAGSSYESESLVGLIDQDILGQIEPDRVRSVFVSLKAQPGQGGAIISSPYEHRIAELDYGTPTTITFRLLQDREEVTVAVTYAGRLDEKVVLLEKDASANTVSIRSTQFSQEADLGGQADYDLALERFTDEADTFRLAVAGLPRDVRYEFRDPASGARLTQVRFPVGVSQRDLTLSLYLPQRAGGSLPREALDHPLSFFALVMDQVAATALDRLQTAAAAEDAGPEGLAHALAEMRAGTVALELIPRGVGKVEMISPNLYHEILPSGRVEMEVSLRNTGSRRLDSLRLLTDTQPGWRALVEPELVSVLPVDGETRLGLTIKPPSDVAVGDYRLRLRAETAAADRRVESEEVSVRIHVRAAANPWLTGVLATLLLVVIGGIVIIGIRLTRS